MPLGLGEAGIEDPVGLGHGVLTEFEHGHARFATTADEPLDRNFEMQPIEHDEIRLGEVLHIARRWLKGVGVHAFWDQAMHVQQVPTYLLDHIRQGRD
jgi:hypothetical protein